MSAERLETDDGPVPGRDVLPFVSPKVLYPLYAAFETATQRIMKREPILQSRGLFALRIKAMLPAELLTEIRRWQRSPEDAYADDIPA